MSRILIVDDDPDILRVMETLLTMKGFSVESTSCGDAIFDKIESFKPDLILMDVLISGKDGRLLCQEIKSNENLRHLPVLMISAHPGAAANIQEYGADGFIPKPFKVNFLINMINEQLAVHNS